MIREPVKSFVRFTLTIAESDQSYKVPVSGDCYDLVRVGDPWPSDHDACR